MGVQIVYTSRTGNTEKLAEAVFAAVPVKEKNVNESRREQNGMTERCIWLGSGRIAGQQVRRSWICLETSTGKRLHCLEPAAWGMCQNIMTGF